MEELDKRFRAIERNLRDVEPPRYVTAALGPRPEDRASRQTWDRALHAIERYRARHGVNDAWRALGPRPERPELAAWLLANRELERATQALERVGGGRRQFDLSR